MKWGSMSGHDGSPNLDRRRIEPDLNDLIELARPARTLRDYGGHRRTAEGAGGYRSAYRGRGMAFEESRPYMAGDDVRHLDWRVTARTSKPHTKLYQEERERPVFLLVDDRAAMRFATQGCFKSVMAARLAALLAWAAEQRGDRLGGCIFSESGSQEFKPQRGRRAVLRWLNGLVQQAAPPPEASASPTAFQDALARLPLHAKPGSLVFILSDFRDLQAAGTLSLSRLAGHCEVVLVFIYDPLEQSLPAGRLSFAYGSRQLILNSDTQIRQRHAAAFAGRQQYVQDLARRYRMYFRSCSTLEDPLQVLMSGEVRGGQRPV